MTAADDPGGAFRAFAAPLLATGGVTRSTMMGYPCLRLEGDYFAAWDAGCEALVVKLDGPTVTALVAAGRAEPFAPDGRTFREWALVPASRARTWGRLLDDALAAAARRVAPDR